MLLGIGFASFFIFLGYIFYSNLSMIESSWLGKLESICGCTSHFNFFHHPWIFTALFFIGAGLLAIFSIFIFKIIKIIKSTNNFIKVVIKNKKRIISSKLAKEIYPLKLNNKIIEISDQRFIIFCYGFFRPKICISDDLVAKLDPIELKAVLNHEKHHLESLAPIKLLFIKIINKVLFFVPGVSQLASEYAVILELAADERATNNFGDKNPLARALYKIIKWREKILIEESLAVSFFESTLEERIKKLEGGEISKSLILNTAKLFAGILILAVSFMAINIFSNFSKAAALNHDDKVCLDSRQHSEYQCRELVNSICAMNYSYESQFCEEIKMK